MKHDRRFVQDDPLVHVTVRERPAAPAPVVYDWEREVDDDDCPAHGIERP